MLVLAQPKRATINNCFNYYRHPMPVGEIKLTYETKMVPLLLTLIYHSLTQMGRLSSDGSISTEAWILHTYEKVLHRKGIRIKRTLTR
jgi:hypothetical protein